jgi:endonuclease YncB( thermonuclease family)
MCRLPRKDNPKWFKVALVALPLAAGSAVFLYDGPPAAVAVPQTLLASSMLPAPSDQASGSFSKCHGAGWTCVVDGDTIRYQGEKIRIANINTPETFQAQCASERALGNRATQRLIVLLNQGAFTLEPIDRETDQYGRTLRIITRGGESLGDALVAEGLAEPWTGRRREWC